MVEARLKGEEPEQLQPQSSVEIIDRQQESKKSKKKRKSKNKKKKKNKQPAADRAPEKRN